MFNKRYDQEIVIRFVQLNLNIPLKKPEMFLCLLSKYSFIFVSFSVYYIFQKKKKGTG